MLASGFWRRDSLLCVARDETSPCRQKTEESSQDYEGDSPIRDRGLPASQGTASQDRVIAFWVRASYRGECIISQYRKITIIDWLLFVHQFAYV